MVRPLCAAVAAVMIAGCGSHPREKDSALTFERLDPKADTTGISRGTAMLREFEVDRDGAGAMRAKGRMEMPDATVLELYIYPPGGSSEVLGRTRFTLRDHQFESPPVFGPGGPLPVGNYHFQLLGRFDPDIQPADVMAAVGNGSRLRGPGIIRSRSGTIVFIHDLEARR